MKKNEDQAAFEAGVEVLGRAFVEALLQGKAGLEITPTGAPDDDGRVSIMRGFTIRLTPPAE